MEARITASCLVLNGRSAGAAGPVRVAGISAAPCASGPAAAARVVAAGEEIGFRQQRAFGRHRPGIAHQHRIGRHQLPDHVAGQAFGGGQLVLDGFARHQDGGDLRPSRRGREWHIRRPSPCRPGRAGAGPTRTPGRNSATPASSSSGRCHAVRRVRRDQDHGLVAAARRRARLRPRPRWPIRPRRRR